MRRIVPGLEIRVFITKKKTEDRGKKSERNEGEKRKKISDEHNEQ
jgi:hypothetical protein